MKKVIFNSLSLFLALGFIQDGYSKALSTPSVDEMTLEKVVIFSRHGIRAPLIGYGSVLAESTPYKWPEWKTKPGYLTPQGAKLESILGQYLGEWVRSNGLLVKEKCPTDDVFIYTNAKPRTIDTGIYFAKGAFKGCNVPIRYLGEYDSMDNTFNPIVRSKVDEDFTKRAMQSVDKLIGKGGFAQLNQMLQSNYDVIAQVLNVDQSPICLQKHQCRFGDVKNSLTFVMNKEPSTKGALRNGTGVGDSFILQYYEGFPEHDVAWNRIKDEQDWRKIIAVKDWYNQILFGTEVMAKEAATPLLKFIQNSFVDSGYHHPYIHRAQQAKLVLLVGHDSNVGSLLPLLRVKDYQLPGQLEKTPISGKIAFEKWVNKSGQAFMKVEYIYQTGEQLRNAVSLSLNTPPKHVILELENCPVDKNGFCPMEQFERSINIALQ